jgi:hypothetical protein
MEMHQSCIEFLGLQVGVYDWLILWGCFAATFLCVAVIQVRAPVTLSVIRATPTKQLPANLKPAHESACGKCSVESGGDSRCTAGNQNLRHGVC